MLHHLFFWFTINLKFGITDGDTEMKKLYGFAAVPAALGMSLVLGFVAALAFAGGSDYEYEQHQAELYCKMVARGSWPAFKGECIAKEDKG